MAEHDENGTKHPLPPGQAPADSTTRTGPVEFWEQAVPRQDPRGGQWPDMQTYPHQDSAYQRQHSFPDQHLDQNLPISHQPPPQSGWPQHALHSGHGRETFGRSVPYEMPDHPNLLQRGGQGVAHDDFVQALPPAVARDSREEDFVSAATRSQQAQQRLRDEGELKQRAMDEINVRPKLRHRRSVRALQMLMSLVFFTAVVSALFFMYSRYQIDRSGPLDVPAIFEVERGQGLSQIAEKLENSGIVRDRKLFAMNVVATKKAKRLKAGKYRIPERASMQQVLDILITGRAIYNQITVVEGTTSEQTVELLRAQPNLVGEIAEIPAEGTLMPETYQFTDGMDRNKIIEQMRNAQSLYLAEQWQKRQPDLPLNSPEEALTLASVVEKETGVPHERPLVAGVFVNRLRKGMKLQSDPTIIYGLVGGKGKLGHPIRRSELEKKTQYNTYQIPGLPPTPIANPGREAIAAVLNPEKTDHVYFVADGTGGHAFASTLKEHQANVAKWRQVEAQKRAAAEKQAAELATEDAKQPPVDGMSSPATDTSLAGIRVEPAVATPKETIRPDAGQLPAGTEQGAIATNGWDNSIPLPSKKSRR